MPTQGAFTDYGERVVLSHFFSNTYSKPTNYYIGALTAITNKEEGTVTEVSGNGYSRVAVSSSTGFAWNSSQARIENASEITFPAATGPWGTIIAIAVYDTSTGGTPIAIAELDEAKTIGTNDVLSFAAGNIRISLD